MCRPSTSAHVIRSHPHLVNSPGRPGVFNHDPDPDPRLYPTRQYGCGSPAHRPTEYGSPETLVTRHCTPCPRVRSNCTGGIDEHDVVQRRAHPVVYNDREGSRHEYGGETVGGESPCSGEAEAASPPRSSSSPAASFRGLGHPESTSLWCRREDEHQNAPRNASKGANPARRREFDG
ncbi:hypothetical protein BDZ89DRAFT_1113666 [Hymenopellis radicata]|nr:hypothetical protein BDZ89DRAFT_1113666 [Hymenopellis radicata]